MTAFLSSKNSVVALVNAKLPTAVAADQMTFGTPVALTDHVSGKNTSVRVSLGPSAPYKGSFVIYYDRLNFADLANFESYKTFGVDGASVYDDLSVFTDAFGIVLTQDDVEDDTFVADGDAVTVNLVAKTGSLGWIGSYEASFKNLPLLSSLFSSNVLPGF